MLFSMLFELLISVDYGWTTRRLSASVQGLHLWKNTFTVETARCFGC